MPSTSTAATPEARNGTMRLIGEFERRRNALQASEVAALLGVTRQHIYKMAAQQLIPSFRVGAAVRFDPHQVADWLRKKTPQHINVASEMRVAV